MYGREFHEWQQHRDFLLKRAACAEDAAEQLLEQARQNVSEANRLLRLAAADRRSFNIF